MQILPFKQQLPTGVATGLLGAPLLIWMLPRLQGAAVLPKSDAMRLISELKSSSGDPAGGGEGDPTDNGRKAIRVQADPLPRLSFSLIQQELSQ